MVEITNLIKLELESLKTLRCLLFFSQQSIVNALREFVNIEKIGHRYVDKYSYLKCFSTTNIEAELDNNKVLGRRV